MTKPEFFERAIRVATADLSPDAISAELALTARAALAAAIASGEGSEHYERFVNGREGVVEEAVQAPGPIVYRFNHWETIIEETLTVLRRFAPAQSGRFARSFIVASGGKRLTQFDAIPKTATVIVFNAQPYSRKIHVGAMQMSVRPRLFDRARRALLRRVPRDIVQVQVRFLDLPGGLHRLVPYRLRRGGGRKDRQAGGTLTYPALVLTMAAV